MTAPAHIPPELVVAFDHIADPDYLADPIAAWDRVRAVAPIVYSDRLGGFWVVTDPEIVRETLTAVDLFSNRQLTIPPYEGPPLVPSELDPPEHGKYRALVIPSFSPAAVERISSRLERTVDELIDNLDGRTEIDFVAEFARPLPAAVFARFCDVTDADTTQLIEWVHGLSHGPSPEGAAALGAMRGYLHETLEARRGRDGDDLLTHVANAEVDGAPIDPMMAESMAFLLVLGGLDTTSGFMSLVWHYLATHVDVRRSFVRDQASIDRGLERFLQVFGNANPTRVVTRDVEWHSVQMHAGDLVMVGLTGANRNAGTEIDPMHFAADAPACPHLTFGLRNHRCVGLHLARRELSMAIRAWHERFPDYELVESDLRFHGGGVFGLAELPLRLG